MGITVDEVVLGLDCILKINNTEVENVQDVTLNTSAGEADVTTRGNAGWRQTKATLKEATLEFTILKIESDSTYVTLRDAFLSNTTVHGWVGHETGGQTYKSLSGDWSVTNFSEEQPLEEAVKINVTLKMAAIDDASSSSSSSGG